MLTQLRQWANWRDAECVVLRDAAKTNSSDGRFLDGWLHGARAHQMFGEESDRFVADRLPSWEMLELILSHMPRGWARDDWEPKPEVFALAAAVGARWDPDTMAGWLIGSGINHASREGLSYMKAMAQASQQFRTTV